MTSEPIRAAIYVRISQDTQGQGLGVARQKVACRDLADRLGWQVVDVYDDNDVSAYNRKKQRPGYQRMLTDVRAGRVTGIIAWAADRLHRQTRELVKFIDLVEEHGVAVQTVIGGKIDLTSSVGRMTARVLGSIAEYESDLKRERVNEKIAELVRAGKVHNGGARPFGYTRIYAGEGPRRKIIRDEVCEPEAALIRQARDAVFAGRTVYSIVKDWNGRGILTSTGKPWSGQALRLMLASGRIAGIKEHKRQPVGDATWPAIISKGDHERLKAIFAERAAAKPESAQPTGRRYWLTGHVFCEGCGMAMRVSRRVDYGRLRYQCPPRGLGGCGGRAVDYASLDAFVSEVVLTRLDRPGIFAELAARLSTSDARLDVLTEAIKAEERKLQGLQAALADCEPEELLELRAAIRAVRSRINAKRDELASAVGAQPLVGVDLTEIWARWKSMTPMQQAGLLAVAGIDRVVIHPAKVRGRFDPDRVEFVPIGRSH